MLPPASTSLRRGQRGLRHAKTKRGPRAGALPGKRQMATHHRGGRRAAIRVLWLVSTGDRADIAQDRRGALCRYAPLGPTAGPGFLLLGDESGLRGGIALPGCKPHRQSERGQAPASYRRGAAFHKHCPWLLRRDGASARHWCIAGADDGLANERGS